MFTILFFLGGPALAQVSPAPSPPQNPFSVPKARLGKALFWDEQLSSTGMTACGTCHVLDLGGGSDPRSRTNPLASTHPGQDQLFGTADDVLGSQGVIRSNAQGNYESSPLFGLKTQVTGRKAPSVINSGFPAELFWDGRAGSFFPPAGGDGGQIPSALESQALEPLVDPQEMGHDGIQWGDLEMRLPALRPLAFSPQIPPALAEFIGNRTYAELFASVFDTPIVTRERVIMAIATYQRSLVSDEILQRLRPLTEQESLGGSFFDSAMFCGMCHFGARFTDDRFHDIGVSLTSGDPGRGAVTGNPEDMGAFRTPSLHNVELRAPYFHDGSAATLEDVVDFYHTGPGSALFAGGLPLQPGDKEALVAYMRTFTDPRVAAGQPPFDRPQLFSESAGVPGSYGTSTPRLGIAPEMIAVEPPSLANPNFTIGLRNAFGEGTAILLFGPDPVMEGIPFYGITAFVDPATLAASPFLAISGLGVGNGYVSRQLPLALMGAGTQWYAQWLILDPASPSPQPPGPGTKYRRASSPRWISASEAVSFTVF